MGIAGLEEHRDSNCRKKTNQNARTVRNFTARTGVLLISCRLLEVVCVFLDENPLFFAFRNEPGGMLLVEL